MAMATLSGSRAGEQRVAVGTTSLAAGAGCGYEPAACWLVCCPAACFWLLAARFDMDFNVPVFAAPLSHFTFELALVNTRTRKNKLD